MDSLLVLYCLTLAAVVMLALLIKAWANYMQRKLQATLIHNAAMEALGNMIFLRIEDHDNMKFAYNAITSEFVTQGKDMDEVNINFGKLFPTMQGLLIEDETPNVL